MTTKIEEKQLYSDFVVDSVRILSDITRKDIEKSYDLNNQGTEAYYSNRYGWTLRKTIV